MTIARLVHLLLEIVRAHSGRPGHATLRVNFGPGRAASFVVEVDGRRLDDELLRLDTGAYTTCGSTLSPRQAPQSPD